MLEMISLTVMMTTGASTLSTYLDKATEKPDIKFRAVIQETLDDEVQSVPFAKRVY
jgi:hypothetical protein